ncbi:MAG: hypothetical protein WDN28_29160 [Chthoniobacter sp.]
MSLLVESTSRIVVGLNQVAPVVAQLNVPPASVAPVIGLASVSKISAVGLGRAMKSDRQCR